MDNKIPPLQRPPRTTNSFNKGMKQDRDPQYLSPDTYFESVNGRIIKNKNGTFAWENLEGTKVVFDITPGYFLLGFAEFSDKCVIVSSNDTNSEVGIMTIDADSTNGTYTPIFNDIYDPNGQLLNFRFGKKMECIAVRENTQEIERVLINDR